MKGHRMERIGITTTVPSEVIWAAGMRPVDLNNLFITSPRRHDYIRIAERDGYPRNVCGWIKGMYGVLAAEQDIKTVVAVTQGDCSNTHALMETLQIKGIETIPFAYPFNRSRDELAREIESLAERLGTTLSEAERMNERLEPVRTSLDTIDDLTWQANKVTGYENHIRLVSSSDCNGNIETYGQELEHFIDEANLREPFRENVRLGFLGVPPIFDDIYHAVESFGARFVFNEVQRQFSLPFRDGDLVNQYLSYTYPYNIFHRLDYIIPELKRRNIQGVIHYVQSFCHRHIEDLVLRKILSIPVLTIEGETPGNVDERTKIRLQAFIEMLGA